MQTEEILYQTRRLAHHPSVALWDGCNECNGHGIYASFVMTTVAQEDPSRPPWPSCPANGWASGVDALWNLPNGSPLGLNPHALPPPEDSEMVESQLASRFPILTGTCASQSERAFERLGCNSSSNTPNDNCVFVSNQDYDSGTMGPNAKSPSPADCCAQCAARSDCWAAAYSPGVCWFKSWLCV